MMPMATYVVHFHFDAQAEDEPLESGIFETFLKLGRVFVFHSAQFIGRLSCTKEIVQF